jgi:uncharacterized protein (UPF0332 family)
MTKEEQEKIKAKEHAEAVRYIANAEDDLKRAGKDGKHFKDAKYVRRASGTAYNAVLIALDAWLILKGAALPKGKSRKTVIFYNTEVSKRDKKLAKDFKMAYDTLHLSGYYDGSLSSGTIADGFEAANSIISRINPFKEAL